MEVAVPEFKIIPKIILNPRSTALIIVDMQVDFVSPKGKLSVPDAPKTIAAIRRLIEKAREGKATIIFTQDWHRADDPEFAIWPSHAVEGTPGATLIPQLKPLPEDYLIRKRTYDAFFGTDLDIVLRQKGIRKLVIAGTVANICVLHTAGSARLRGYEIVLPQDAISALSPFDYAAALRQASFLYQGKITRSAGIHFLGK
jgi:nicotinamidase-related amidase